jgi:hypothetical protein
MKRKNKRVLSAGDVTHRLQEDWYKGHLISREIPFERHVAQISHEKTHTPTASAPHQYAFLGI